MITGDIKNQIDRIWDAFWSGGISNPLEVIEQITYLLFLRRLDDLHTLEENKANRLKRPMERRIFPEGRDPKGRLYEDFRWSRFKHFAPAEMYTIVSEHIFPYLREGLARQLGNGDSTYAHHMKGARFTIPTPALLAKVVDLLDHVPMEDRDTKGDIDEYMLAKIATAGQNGQFCTPRHIIRLMVELTAPTPTDVICDPACGTAGFLVVADEYLRERYPNLLHDPKLREHFHHRMFHGFDFDNTMLRKGWMLAKQVLRSATSVGANDRSARRTKSKADFIAKLAVAEEEADETCYWLELIVEAELLPRERVEPLLREAMEITAMLTAAGKTAKQNK